MLSFHDASIGLALSAFWFIFLYDQNKEDASRKHRIDSYLQLELQYIELSKINILLTANIPDINILILFQRHQYLKII